MDDGLHIPAEFDRLQAPSSAYAPRQVVTYLCTREHVMSVPFAADAEVPEVWDCRCGQPATRAGAAAALEARRLRPGASVLLVDKAAFPRDKACGDGLGPHAVDELEALGAGGVLEGYPPIRGLRLRSPRGMEVAGDPARPNYVVPRAVLDARLVAAAQAAGAELHRSRVRRLEQRDGLVVVDGEL